MALTKELQLMHVTREFQQMVKSGGTSVVKVPLSKEREALEGLLK
jgi:hypothetical protein